MNYIVEIGTKTYAADSRAVEIVLTHMLKGAPAAIISAKNSNAVGNLQDYVAFNGSIIYKGLPKPN